MADEQEKCKCKDDCKCATKPEIKEVVSVKSFGALNKMNYDAFMAQEVIPPGAYFRVCGYPCLDEKGNPRIDPETLKPRYFDVVILGTGTDCDRDHTCFAGKDYFDFCESSECVIPIAAISVENGQDSGNIVMVLSGTVDAANQPILTAAWSVKDVAGNVIASGDDLPGTVTVNVGNRDNESLTACYTVTNECGTSLISSAAFTTSEPKEDTLHVFEYTGADQKFTIPDGAKTIKVQAWGAAGGNNAATNPSFSAGPGGYAGGTFNTSESGLAPGDEICVVVGEGGEVSYAFGQNVPASYGFGGGASELASSGGGLSGIFTGSTAVAASDAARALVVAGGGGGSDLSINTNGVTFNIPGYAGGETSTAGGEATMAGANGPDNPGTAGWGSGAGGGYAGGGHHQDGTGATTASQGGDGGTNFVAASASSPSTLFTASNTGLNPPNISNANYVSGVGVVTTGLSVGDGQGGNGLVVLCVTY